MLSGIALVVFSSLIQLISAVEIKLRANESIATTLRDVNGDILFFQPEEPPASPMACSEQSPCGGNDCGLEMVCGGSLPLELSADNTLKFVWQAPDDSVIRIKGNYNLEGLDYPPRTRVELELKTSECQAEYQDIDIETVTVAFDDGGTGHSQSYTLEKGDSFVELGADCTIFTRMQFHPAVDGILDLEFTELSISVSIDSQKVVQGLREYEWSTSGYIWMRKPEPDGLIKLETVGFPSTTTSTTTSLTTATLQESTAGTDLESKPTPLPTDDSPDLLSQSNLSTNPVTTTVATISSTGQNANPVIQTTAPPIATSPDVSSSSTNFNTFVASSFLIPALLVAAM